MPGHDQPHQGGRRRRPQMLSPAGPGIRGNSHMIMQDKNHLQIADLILQWIDEHVSKRSGRQEVTIESPTSEREASS